MIALGGELRNGSETIPSAVCAALFIHRSRLPMGRTLHVSTAIHWIVQRVRIHIGADGCAHNGSALTPPAACCALLCPCSSSFGSDFTESMKALGYPRLISVENFRTPNFELVADALYWLVHRYDPSAEVDENISSENHRVEFLKAVATIMVRRANRQGG